VEISCHRQSRRLLRFVRVSSDATSAVVAVVAAALNDWNRIIGSRLRRAAAAVTRLPAWPGARPLSFLDARASRAIWSHVIASRPAASNSGGADGAASGCWGDGEENRGKRDDRLISDGRVGAPSTWRLLSASYPPYTCTSQRKSFLQ